MRLQFSYEKPRPSFYRTLARHNEPSDDPSERLVLLIRHVLEAVLELRRPVLLVTPVVASREHEAETQGDDDDGGEAHEDAGEALVVARRVFPVAKVSFECTRESVSGLRWTYASNMRGPMMFPTQ